MKPPAASPSASSWSGALRIRWGLLLALAIVAAYGGALRSPFLFDDEVAVVGNSTIRQLASWSVFQPPANGGTTTGRPLVNFSFALDHALGGGRPEVFHATNLLLHILSALCLWGLLRRWFRAQGMPSPLPRVAEPAALGLAAMWALHPLGTETVICIAQRTEALFSLLLLVCLYTFQRGSTATGPRWPWLVASVASCLMGMAAKEVMVMAPLLVLLADRTFVAGSLAAALRKRRVYYLALAATWLAAATLLLVNGGARGQAAGFGLGVTPWQYLLTQCEALVTYLRLVVWPHPLVLDYGNAVVSGVSEVWWQGLLVIGAVSLTIWALWRHPVLGFCGAWFFLLLAPSSSVVPLVTQTMAEHRMYLPLMAPLALLALGCLAYNGGRGAWLLLVVAPLLGAVTARRAATFRDAVTIWQDTVDSRPSNARAHRQLAAAWSAAGRVDLADQHYATAIALQPGDPLGHYNWGVALLGLNRPHEAAREFTSALTLRPDYADARVNLGIALLRDGQAQEAFTALQLALAEQPSADLHFNVGVVLEALKRTDEARTHYLAALRLDPGIARAHVQLAHLAEQDGRLDEAIGHKREALRLSPDDPTLLEEIGMLYVRMDRFADAAECFAVLTRRDPNNANAWGNLGNAYLSAGRIKEAVVCYERVLRLRPGDRQTEENLQIAKSALR